MDKIPLEILDEIVKVRSNVAFISKFYIFYS